MRVVDSAAKSTTASPQKWHLLSHDVRSLVLRRLIGEFRRAKTQRRRYPRQFLLNFNADVTLVRPRGRFRRNSKIAQLFRRHQFAFRLDEIRHRAHNGGDGWTVSRMFVFPPSGGQFRRTHNRGGPANAAARPISPPPLVSSRRDRSIPEWRKQRRLCLNGLAAQSYRHH